MRNSWILALALVLSISGWLGAAGPSEMGKVMGALSKELKGKADGGAVKAVVDNLLS